MHNYLLQCESRKNTPHVRDSKFFCFCKDRTEVSCRKNRTVILMILQMLVKAFVYYKAVLRLTLPEI
jgi:hypothetical protein